MLLHPTKRAGLSRRGYRAAQFKDVWARLLRKPTEESEHPNIRSQSKTPKTSKAAWAEPEEVNVRMFGSFDEISTMSRTMRRTTQYDARNKSNG